MKKLFLIGLLTVIAYAVMPSDVMVTWEHSNGPDNVSGYNIYYGQSSRVYTNFVTTGYVNNTVISNLSPNVPFYFSGTTIDPDGLETIFGNELQFTATPPVTNGLPSAVKDFMITKVSYTIY